MRCKKLLYACICMYKFEYLLNGKVAKTSLNRKYLNEILTKTCICSDVDNARNMDFHDKLDNGHAWDS